MNCTICNIKIDGRLKLSKEEGLCMKCHGICESAPTDKELITLGLHPAHGAILEKKHRWFKRWRKH